MQHRNDREIELRETRVSITLLILIKLNARVKWRNESLRYKKTQGTVSLEVDDKNSSDLRWKTHMTGFEEELYRYERGRSVGRRVIFKTIECRDDRCLISSSKHTAFAFTFSRGRDEPDTLFIYLFLFLCLSNTIAAEINYFAGRLLH